LCKYITHGAQNLIPAADITMESILKDSCDAAAFHGQKVSASRKEARQAAEVAVLLSMVAARDLL
jgi:hypothetical protein